MNLEMLDVVVYTIYKSNELESFGKTMLQKIIYFALDENEQKEYFVPYFYGPYSEDVQFQLSVLFNNEFIEFNNDNNTNLKFRSSKENSIMNYIDKSVKQNIDNRILNRIDKLIEFINKNKLSAKDFSLIAKYHIIKERVIKKKYPKKTQISLQDIKENSAFYNWVDFDRMKEKKFSEILCSYKEVMGFYN